MANYLPVLIGSVNTVPDDSVLSDLPRGQVDYLSHDWREEDVWRSWRNMTRLKNEIANGVRLENASWRTWWKQRNGLKTVTPETLNWLKDSDVTWLYGPLHTAQQPIYTPKPSPTTAAALDLSSSPSPSPTLSQPSNGVAKKPILKHRSISELLTSDFPLSPLFSPPDSDDESSHAPECHIQNGSQTQAKPSRPSLMHTKSDTHITRWGPSRAFRRDSPPRIIPAGAPSATELQSTLLQPLNATEGVSHQKRKHISFNTFVEQCIAIDQPQKRQPSWPSGVSRNGAPQSTEYGNGYSLEDDGYDEDSEDGIIDETEELLFAGDEDDITRSSCSSCSPNPHACLPLYSHHAPHNGSPPSSSTSEDDDDDVLEMRVRHVPSNPHICVARSSSHSSSSSSHSRPPTARSATYTNGRSRTNAHTIMASPSVDKELVTIAIIAPTTLKTRADEDEDYSFPHLQARSLQYPQQQPGAPQSRQWESYSPQDSPVELVYVPPPYIYADRAGDVDSASIERQVQMTYENDLTPRSQLFSHQMTTSPDPQEEAPIHREFADVEAKPILEPTADRAPEVIVSSEDGAEERDRSRSRSHSRSRSRSRSRTPSPNTIITQQPAAVSPSVSAPIPNISATTPSPTLLSPPDAGLSRGRSSSSPMLSSQAQTEQPRGRSVTRTASFSDRTGAAPGSPFGSLSPDSNMGLGIGIYTRDRDRERETRRTGDRGRERERFGRSPGSASGSSPNSSTSPEDQRQPPQPVVAISESLSPPEAPQIMPDPVNELHKKSSSLSSSSGSSTVSVTSTVTTRPPPRLVVNAKPVTQTDFTEAPSLPSSSSVSPVKPPSPSLVQLMKEDQERISPVTSPIRRSPTRNVSPTSFSFRHERRSSGGSHSPIRGSDDDGQGLVGRAVEIMSNAGAFLGSFWHGGAQAGVTPS